PTSTALPHRRRGRGRNASCRAPIGVQSTPTGSSFRLNSGADGCDAGLLRARVGVAINSGQGGQDDGKTSTSGSDDAAYARCACGWGVGCLGWRPNAMRRSGGSDHHQRRCHRRTGLQPLGATVEGNVTVEPGGSLKTEEGTETTITGNVQSNKATEIVLLG